MSSYTIFGPGSITVKVGAGTAIDYAGEVLSFTLNHTYADVGENRTMLNGDKRKGQRRRDPDSVTFTFEPDLTSAGLYSMLQSNDLEKAILAYTPSSADGAKWEGEVELSLPETVDGTEFGIAIAGSCTWLASESLAFTPAS